MIDHLDFQYRFHAAGQGVFASGTVRSSNGQIPFHWVFDCGSVNVRNVLKQKVVRYRDLVLGDAPLDLLCISHFDHDHVSGLSTLLKDLQIGTIVLPYLSPLERLILGSKMERTDREYLKFLTSPVDVLLEHAKSIDRIILIGRNPPEDEVNAEGQPWIPNEPGIHEKDRRPSWQLKPDHHVRFTDPHRFVNSKTLKRVAKNNTQILATSDSFELRASSASFHETWEFCFHHKPISPEVVSRIKREVMKALGWRTLPRRITELRDGLTEVSTRKKIKKAYVAALDKSGPDDINSTSLCVYSGPVLVNYNGGWISTPWPNTLISPRLDTSHAFGPWPGARCSILYTGDANLKRAENLKDLINFLGRERWEDVAILQVPHHGSRYNWEPSSVEDFNHCYSVFCADEHNLTYGHPHREVLLSLMAHGPILANRETGWGWTGSAHFA